MSDEIISVRISKEIRQRMKMREEINRSAIVRRAILQHLEKEKKIRLISSSWSTNARKGFDAYQYLDENLDFSQFEYQFIGRAPAPFKNIKLIDAVPSAELGQYLRNADIFIFTSWRESASNALLEAINCGLPVIYYADSGGNKEFTWYSV